MSFLFFCFLFDFRITPSLSLLMASAETSALDIENASLRAEKLAFCFVDLVLVAHEFCVFLSYFAVHV